MIVFVLLLVVLLVASGLVFALGAGLVGAIPLLIAAAVGVWLVWAFLGARSPGTVGRRAHSADLLGPGDADDPDNTVNHGRAPETSSRERV